MVLCLYRYFRGEMEQTGLCFENCYLFLSEFCLFEFFLKVTVFKNPRTYVI